MLGLKIENPKATANAAKTTKVPGIAFAEWGPGDQAFYLVGMPQAQGGGEERMMNPAMRQARATVFKATKDANIAFLNACNENNVIDMIKEGVKICTGGDGPGAEKSRQFTKRQGPW